MIAISLISSNQKMKLSSFFKYLLSETRLEQLTEQLQALAGIFAKKNYFYLWNISFVNERSRTALKPHSIGPGEHGSNFHKIHYD